jgi:hypothetical protein
MSSPIHGPGQIRFWLCVGLVIGMLGGVTLTWRWTAAGAGTRIAVLGSGKSVSVLVTHDQRRILIASGSSGSAFSNTLGSTLPPFADNIDLVLVDPRSSADLVDRLGSLDAKRMMLLPDPERDKTADTVLRSFQVDLGDDVVLVVRIEPAATWSAELQTSAGIISISPNGESRTAAPVRISLDGTAGVDPGGLPAIWIGPAANGLVRSTHLATVGAGSVLPITIDGSAFRIPREFFGEGESGQGANHLARLDGQSVVELRPD